MTEIFPLVLDVKFLYLTHIWYECNFRQKIFYKCDLLWLIVETLNVFREYFPEAQSLRWSRSKLTRSIKTDSPEDWQNKTRQQSQQNEQTETYKYIMYLPNSTGLLLNTAIHDIKNQV